MNIDQWSNKLDVSEPQPIHRQLHPPPNAMGIGSEEDSLENCKHLRPKPAKKDLVRMMVMTGEVLRFEARIVDPAPEDEVRRFVISYYPADWNTAVFEVPVRNNGFVAGKFVDK